MYVLGSDDSIRYQQDTAKRQERPRNSLNTSVLNTGYSFGDRCNSRVVWSNFRSNSLQYDLDNSSCVYGPVLVVLNEERKCIASAGELFA